MCLANDIIYSFCRKSFEIILDGFAASMPKCTHEKKSATAAMPVACCAKVLPAADGLSIANDNLKQQLHHTKYSDKAEDAIWTS